MTAILYPSHNLCNLLLFSCFCTPYSSSVPSVFLSSEACALHQTFVCLSASFHHFLFPVLTLPRLFFFLWAPKETKRGALHGQIRKNNVLISFLNVSSFVLCSFNSLFFRLFFLILLSFLLFFYPSILSFNLASSVVLHFAISMDIFISFITLPVLQPVFAIFVSVFNSFYIPLPLSGGDTSSSSTGSASPVPNSYDSLEGGSYPGMFQSQTHCSSK